MGDNDISKDSDLRQRAELSLQDKTELTGHELPQLETHRLLHELQVHQVELKMQNEELWESRAALETALARYTDFYDFAPCGFISLNQAGLVLQSNLPGAHLLGIQRNQLVGQPLTEFIVHDDRGYFHDCLRSVFVDGARQTCIFGMLGPGSEPISVRFEGILAADGCEARTVLMDISDQRRAAAEHEKLQEELYQARKMDSVGQLAGGVAHDFNNSLAAILGFTELAAAESELGHSVTEDLDKIRKAAEHSAALVRQLLAFARQQIVVPQVVDVNQAVDSALNMVRRLIGESIHLVWQPAATIWPVRIDPNQVDQIIVNLCVNARDAMSGSGTVTIKSANITLDQTNTADFPEASGAVGEFVLLTVRDTGEGIRREDRARIFEPFYTTKELGAGTGLGLATVYGIVKQNEGHIGVQSELEVGTTFRILLPRHDEAASTTLLEAEPGAPALGAGEKTVLVVEDDSALLDLTRRMLESLGHRVLTAASPSEALRVAQEHDAEIHLLVTDVVMPEMNGKVLAERLNESRPGLRQLFMSGYPADIIAHHGIVDDRFHFLQKPFVTSDLAKSVKEALES